MIIIVAVVVIVIIVGYFISKSSGSTPTVQSKTSPQQINVSLKVTEEESPEETDKINQELTPKGNQEGTPEITPDGNPEGITKENQEGTTKGNLEQTQEKNQDATTTITPNGTTKGTQEETQKKNENSASSVPTTLNTTVPYFPTPHSNPIIDEVVKTIFEKPHEYGYYDEQDIKDVVIVELTKVSINKWNWNWKKNLIKNLILNSVNALKNLKVEQVKQKIQKNNYTLNKDLDLDKLIRTVINKNKQLKNNTDEIYKHVIEEINRQQNNGTSPQTLTRSPSLSRTLSNSLSTQLSKSLSKSPTLPTPPSPTLSTPPSPTLSTPTLPTPPSPSPPLSTPSSPTTSSPTTPNLEPKNDNFMNLLHLLSSSRM